MSKPLYRFFRAESVADNPRLVKVAFSSETPVLRVGDGIDHDEGAPYWEVLDHSAGSYDLTLLQNRGAVLDEHDPKCPIGVVSKADVGEDRIGRADLEMDDDEDSIGCERCRQMRSGMRPHISFGYDQTRLMSSTKGEDGVPIKRFAWRAHEISSVAIPADGNVGVGRKFDNNQPSPNKHMPDPVIVIDENKIRLDSLAAERTRVNGITSAADILAKDHPHCAEKIRTIVNECLGKETSLQDFQIRAMQEVLGAKPVNPITMDELGMNEREQKSYSVLRGIQSSLRRGGKLPDGLEGEVHGALVKRCGSSVSFEGFGVPHDANVRCTPSRRNRHQRDLNVSVFSQGGAAVATQIVTPIIEILRNREVCVAMGITVMGGLTSNVAVPRQTGAATAYALPESATLTKSTQALDQILLSPHRVGAWNDYTRQFLLQSSIDAENFIREDLMKQVALKWDALILNGQGAGSEPLGILNTPGIGSVFVTQGAPTYTQMVAFETALAVLNADNGNMGFVSTPAVRGVLKTTAAVLTGATTVAAGPMSAIWQSGQDGEGEMTGYRGLISNQVPYNEIIFGHWAEVIQGLYGGFDIIVNPYSRDTDAAVRVTINSFGDVALRHAASFAASAGPAV